MSSWASCAKLRDMRTDIHSPTNLVTEDYEFVACGYYGSAGEPGYSPLVHEASYLIDEGWRFGENHSAGDCYHCGAHLKYYAIMKHLPSHTLVQIGETCLGNRFERTSAEFHQLRKQAELDRQAQRIKKHRLAWFAVDPDRELAYLWADEQVSNGHYGYEGMRFNFVSKINRYGDTSDKFVRTIMRDMVRTERSEEERAARAAEEAANSAPVIEGRIEIEGEVLSAKWQENDWGGRLVMTVRDDRGFKVWGSVPAKLRPAPQKGDRIAFSATVEAAPPKKVYDPETAEMVEQPADPTFGFFKRPSNARFLEA